MCCSLYGLLSRVLIRAHGRCNSRQEPHCLYANLYSSTRCLLYAHRHIWTHHSQEAGFHQSRSRSQYRLCVRLSPGVSLFLSLSLLLSVSLADSSQWVVLMWCTTKVLARTTFHPHKWLQRLTKRRVMAITRWALSLALCKTVFDVIIEGENAWFPVCGCLTACRRTGWLILNVQDV